MVSIGPLEQSFAFKDGTADSFEPSESAKSKKRLSEVEEWLDAQPDGSVLYISLGSIFFLNAEEVLELAHGLEASGQRFLWIIRLPDAGHVMVSKQPSKEEISAILPPGNLCKFTIFETTLLFKNFYRTHDPMSVMMKEKAYSISIVHILKWYLVEQAIQSDRPNKCQESF